MMKMFTNHVRSVVLVMTYLGVFHKPITKVTASPTEQCDLNMWYMDRAEEGAFSGELTHQQLRIKTRIESLIAKKPKDGLISCSTLTTFQNILSPVASRQAQVKTENADSGNSTPEGSRRASSEPSAERPESDDSRLPEGIGSRGRTGNSPHKYEERDGTKRNQRNLKSSGEDGTRGAQSDKDKEDEGTRHKQNVEEAGQDQNSTSHTGSNQTRSEQDCPFSSNHQCHGKNQTTRWSDYIFQPTKSSISHSLTYMFVRCKAPVCAIRKRQKIKLRASRLHCHYYHLLNKGHKPQNGTRPEEMTLARRIQESCQLSDRCSWRCLYGTHTLQCVQHYHTQVNTSETSSTQDDNGSHHNDHTEIKNREEESDDTEPGEGKEEEEEGGKGRGEEDPSAAESDETDVDPEHDKEEDTAKKGEHDETEGEGTLTEDKHVKQSNDKEDSTTEEKKNNPKGDSGLGAGKEDASHNMNKHGEAEKKEKTNSDTQDKKKSRHEDPGPPSLSEAELLKIEALLQHKVLEQSTKIQALEILIMRLENHILSQKLNEQNGTGHLVHLENHILRIENELLKLNRSYAALQEENEVLKSRQNKHLALEHKSRAENSRASLPGNTSEYFQLVTKQQEKISVLSDLLNNQSSALHKLQSRSDQLEEQNQMLHQIILNQTALISQVMHKLQEVSEQTLKNQQETGHLKSMMDVHSASSNILTKLEHMLHDSPNPGNPSVKHAHSQRSSYRADFSQVLTFLHRHPDQSSKPHRHSCGHGESSRMCLHFSLIISPCPPFRTLSWGKCPHVMSVIGPVTGQTSMHRNSFDSLKKTSGTAETDSIRINSAQPDKDKPSSENRPQHDTQNTDKEKEAPDSVDIPSAKTAPEDSESSPTLSDQKKAKSTDKQPPAEMQPLPIKAEDVQEAEATSTGAEDGDKKPEKDRGGPEGREHQEKKTDTPKKTKVQDKAADRDGKAKDKASQDQTNKKDGAKTSGSSDTSAGTHEDTVDKVVRMDKPSSGQSNPSPKGGSKRGGVSAEDRKRKEAAEKAKKLKQEAEALKKRIQEAEKRPLPYGSSDDKKPKDCYDLYKRDPEEQGQLRNGAYKVYVRGLNLYVSVYCDMKAGGWTVLMRREDGSLDFYKEWDDYRDGFGTPYGEHYLGNEAVHYLTNQDHYSLQVDLKDWTGQSRSASYRHFWLEDEDHKFQLGILGYTGTAGDGLGKHDGMFFSTKDRDHDLLAKDKMGGSCAQRFQGAGWYYKCYTSNLMGRHYGNGAVPDKRFDGIAWKPWTGPSYSLKEVVLKVRPKDAK